MLLLIFSINEKNFLSHMNELSDIMTLMGIHPLIQDTHMNQRRIFRIRNMQNFLILILMATI